MISAWGLCLEDWKNGSSFFLTNIVAQSTRKYMKIFRILKSLVYAKLNFQVPGVKAAKGCYYKVYVNPRNFLAKSLMLKSSPIKNLKFCHALEEFKLIIKRSTSKVKGPQKVPEIGSFDSEGSKIIS